MIAIVAAAVVGLLLLCGAGAALGFFLHERKSALAIASAISADASAPTRTFTSRDGVVSLVTPSDWKTIGGDDLSPAVDLGVCSNAEDILIFNVNETAGDFEDDLGLAAYAELVKGLYRENMSATFRNVEMLDLAGYPAQRFPFEGSYGGIRLRGFLFALKSTKNFHHFVLATVPSDYDRLVGVGLAVMATATIISPAGPAPVGTATSL